MSNHDQISISGQTASEIAASIERALRTGDVGDGDALPTIRALATRLGVNRNTVAAAYRRLSDAGIIEGRGRQGSRIALSSIGGESGFASLRNLGGGNPDAGFLPNFQRSIQKTTWKHRGYEDAPEEPRLAELAERRFFEDGVPLGKVWFSNGTFDAISMVLRSALPNRAKIGVEDPCFMTTLGLLRDLGHTPVAMQVDDEGVLPDALDAALNQGIKALIMTPRAHNPYGGSWTRKRRDQLAEVLRPFEDVLLIEDDHFAELSHFDPVTLVEERRENWAVIRSVSKYVGPDARLAFVNSSEQLAKPMAQMSAFTFRWVSGLVQRTVLATLTSPGYEALRRQAADAYRERRMFLLHALAKRGLIGHGTDGFNLWIPVADEQAATRHLLNAGWIVKPGSVFRLESPEAIRVTTSMLSQEQADELADAIYEIERNGPLDRGA